eukprot:scaffold4538_cov410-Prasinococcus_capsulatus_cf.AAC.2
MGPQHQELQVTRGCIDRLWQWLPCSRMWPSADSDCRSLRLRCTGGAASLARGCTHDQCGPSLHVLVEARAGYKRAAMQRHLRGLLRRVVRAELPSELLDMQ